jgi:DNA-binding beta-propeller fold protein YncE
MLFRGELPKIPTPRNVLLPQVGPSLSFPIAGLWRDATSASLPGVGGTDQDTRKWLTAWEGKDDTIGIKGPPYRQLGVDAKWEHCIVVADANGNIVETWDQWDKLLRRPHSVYISPYDPEKHVWVVDDNMQVIYRFTHDGKQLVQTIGTPEQEGADATHFNRPTFIDWLPDGTFFVSDGYTGTRVAKFDKNGKFVMQWGIKGNPPNEKRPNYMNNVHGVAVDPVSRRVFVNDRNNHRVQVFDENGKFLYDWRIDADPSSLHLLYIGQDRNIWTFDRSTHKLLKYDQQGHLLYAWGTLGMFPGALWGVHGMSVDMEGNLYVSEVDSGRVQKFRPKKDANPAFLVAKPVARVWN